MSRFIVQGDMSAAELIGCSHDLLAVLYLVDAVVAGAEGGGLSPNATWSVGRLMRLAVELHGPLHDALEEHEGGEGAR